MEKVIKRKIFALVLILLMIGIACAAIVTARTIDRGTPGTSDGGDPDEVFIFKPDQCGDPDEFMIYAKNPGLPACGNCCSGDCSGDPDELGIYK